MEVATICSIFPAKSVRAQFGVEVMVQMESFLQIKTNEGLSNVGDPGGFRSRGVLRASKRVNRLSRVRLSDARGCRRPENAFLLDVVHQSFAVIVKPYCGSRKEN